MDIQGSSRSCSLGRRSRVIERKVLGCMKRFTVRSHIAAYVLVSGNISPTAPPPDNGPYGKALLVAYRVLDSAGSWLYGVETGI